ncbi:MAG: DUF1844 domain-containing protein [Microthrixaceae bacterium]|nr:DUF1844 domain-containing protein [Microthrixaceae bacterium]
MEENGEKNVEINKEGEEGGKKERPAPGAGLLRVHTLALYFGPHEPRACREPGHQKDRKEPEVAKQTMNLIALLREKTNGNLTEEEAKLMDEVLHELRLWYVKLAS